MDLKEWGSRTAKDGFRNEDEIILKFNNWNHDADAQAWLVLMNYVLSEIEFVKAVKISGYKTDVQVQVTIKLKVAIDVENLQVKLISNQNGYNQIDKRKVDKYAEMWNIPESVIDILKRYTGEILPTVNNPKDKRRMFMFEFTKLEQNILLEWLKRTQSLIVADILRGQGRFAAEWMLVAQKVNTNARWVLKPMNFCMNYYGNGEISITPKGNIRIGLITLQRKVGDSGRDGAKMLQFKINPAKLFECA